jgi:hypothetical protein
MNRRIPLRQRPGERYNNNSNNNNNYTSNSENSSNFNYENIKHFTQNRGRDQEHLKLMERFGQKPKASAFKINSSGGFKLNGSFSLKPETVKEVNDAGKRAFRAYNGLESTKKKIGEYQQMLKDLAINASTTERSAAGKYKYMLDRQYVMAKQELFLSAKKVLHIHEYLQRMQTPGFNASQLFRQNMNRRKNVPVI